MRYYQFPGGIEYGGSDFEPQTVAVSRLFTATMKPYQRVVFLDLHTGLGSGMQLHMMTDGDLNEGAKHLLATILKPAVDGNLYDLATGDTPGFYPTFGDITGFLPLVQRQDQQVISLTAEYGTIGDGIFPKLQTVNRLILENQGFLHGYTNSSTKTAVERDFLELFYPGDSEWRKMVVDKGRVVFRLILQRMGDLK